MFEMCNQTRRKSNFLGPTGPGPDKLEWGSPSIGYFGETNDSNLPSTWDLLDVVGWNDYQPNYNSVTWLKFVLDRQVLYIAKKPLFGPVSWNDLYNRGLVYGEDSFGRYNTGMLVYQNQVIKLNGEEFRVRLLRGALTDPLETLPANDVELGLLKRSLKTADGSFTPEDLSAGLDNVLLETNVLNIAEHFLANLTTNGIANKHDAVGYWRPVLEYNPKGFGAVETPKALIKFETKPLAKPLALLNTEPLTTVERIHSVQMTSKPPLFVTSTSNEVIDRIVNAIGTTVYKPITVR